MGSNQKGDSNERELVNYFAENHWRVLRAPASGSATDRELPDVLAGFDGTFYIIEAKYSTTGVVYIDQEKVDGLKDFAVGFGGRPRLAARFPEEHGDPSYGEKWPGHYLLPPAECHQTDGGNYRIKKERALEAGEPVNEVVTRG
jgi:Holliday junction resolvase